MNDPLTDIKELVDNALAARGLVAVAMAKDSRPGLSITSSLYESAELQLIVKIELLSVLQDKDQPSGLSALLQDLE